MSNINSYGFTLLSDVEFTGYVSYGTGSYGTVPTYNYKKLINFRDIANISRQ